MSIIPAAIGKNRLKKGREVADKKENGRYRIRTYDFYRVKVASRKISPMKSSS